MFKVLVTYPTFDEEFQVAQRTTSPMADSVSAVVSPEEILTLQRLVREVPVSDHVIRYTLSLVRQTRVGENGVPDFVRDQLAWGAGPRAVQFLIVGAKARALMQRRTHVTVDDIQFLAKPVLRHRIVVNFAAESDGVSSDDVIDRLIQSTPAREDELANDARFKAIFAS
jgi:MoxR-like ATPase